MKVLYCFLSGPWVYVLEKAVAFIMLEVVRVLVEHELLQEPKRLTKLLYF